MKRFLLRLLGLALVAGLAFLALRPVAERQRRLWRDVQAARAYLDATAGLSLLDCGTMLAEAVDYDAARGELSWADPDDATHPDARYATLLDPTGDGVMTVLEVPKLGALLPVYHGGDAARADAGLQHLPASSLPVGGANGRCVLLVPRDAPQNPLRGLDRLIPGDCFTLHTLQDEMIYEVYAASDAPDDGADACALRGADSTTVYGRRVARRNMKPVDDTRELPGWAMRLVFAAPVAAAGWVALAFVEGFRRALRRRKRRRARL